MRIISPKVQCFMSEHVGCFKWLQCSNRHRFLIKICKCRYLYNSLTFAGCPKCGSVLVYDLYRFYNIRVLCA